MVIITHSLLSAAAALLVAAGSAHLVRPVQLADELERWVGGLSKFAARVIGCVEVGVGLLALVPLVDPVERSLRPGAIAIASIYSLYTIYLVQAYRAADGVALCACTGASSEINASSLGRTIVPTVVAIVVLLVPSLSAMPAAGPAATWLETLAATAIALIAWSLPAATSKYARASAPPTSPFNFS